MEEKGVSQINNETDVSKDTTFRSHSESVREARIFFLQLFGGGITLLAYSVFAFVARIKPKIFDSFGIPLLWVAVIGFFGFVLVKIRRIHYLHRVVVSPESTRGITKEDLQSEARLHKKHIGILSTSIALIITCILVPFGTQYALFALSLYTLVFGTFFLLLSIGLGSPL